MLHYVLLLSLLCSAVTTEAKLSGGYFEQIKETSSGGGGQCAACTIAVSLLEQLAEIHNKSITTIVESACTYFPTGFQRLCGFLIDKFGAEVIKMLTNKYTADQVCLSLTFCTDPTCTIRPKAPQPAVPVFISTEKRELVKRMKENPWDWIMALLERVADHKPEFDFDGDLFSFEPVLRGSNWRGKDCNDFDSTVYPGRYKAPYIPSIDHNCNGIKGVDERGNSYEEKFCSESGQLGTIVLGDSAGAHFSIPPEWMTAAAIDQNTYSNLLSVLSNELDWPHQSGITGYVPSSQNLMAESIYKKMVQRNRCNHRDYQNIAVNGCRSGSMYSDVIKTMARNSTLDAPALVFYELIGNDVCSPHKTLDRMTTVEQFKQNVLNSLDYLDQHLPKGSHVVFIGLANGLALWDNMNNRTHPIGVLYSTVYDYLNCLGISPCWVWMNSNETIRNAGQKRANELNTVYPEIIANYTYKNFDMAYYEYPFKGITDMWHKMGGETWQLIEAVDGFHPNQIANSLFADWMWETLQKEHPTFIGKENPYNDEIQKIFGDQGGY